MAIEAVDEEDDQWVRDIDTFVLLGGVNQELPLSITPVGMDHVRLRLAELSEEADKRQLKRTALLARLDDLWDCLHTDDDVRQRFLAAM